MSNAVVLGAAVMSFLIGLSIGVLLVTSDKQSEHDWAKKTPHEKIKEKCYSDNPVITKQCADAEADLIKRGLD